MKRYINKVNLYIIIYFILYFIFSLYIADKCSKSSGRFIYSILFLSVPAFIISCPSFVSLTLSLIVYLVFSFDIYIILNYYNISYDIYTIIVGQDSSIITSFLKNISLKIYFLYFLIIGCSLFLTCKVVRFRPRVALISSIIFIITFVLNLAIPFTKHDKQKMSEYNERIIYNKKDNSYYDAVVPFSTKLYYRRFPGYIGTVLTIADLKIRSALGLYDEHRLPYQYSRSSSAILGKSSEKEDNIILVIGESDLATHHELYGYHDYATTPYMRKLKEQKYLCSISKVHSSASLTRDSVPMIVSFSDPDNIRKYKTEKNLVQLAKENGYDTIWLSSQSGNTSYMSVVGYLSRFSKVVIRPDYSNRGLHYRLEDDEALLPIIKNQIPLLISGHSHFIVIHLMGNHETYSDRITDQDKKALPSAGTYNQAVHHTDHMLEEIIKVSRNTFGDNFTLFYSSDHGEILSDPDHGAHGVRNGGYDQFKVPVYIAGKDHTNFCHLAEEYRNKDGYYVEKMDKYMLLTMMGYKLSEEVINKEKSFDRVYHADRLLDYRDVQKLKPKRFY